MTAKGFKIISDAFKNTKKIKELEELISKQNQEIHNLLYLKSENASLKKVLQYIPEYSLEYVTAPIRLNDSGILSNSFIIDAGNNIGIQLYQPAIVEGAYIGQVVSVSKNFSRINLITDSRSKIPVMIERNRIRAFLVGDNTSYPKLIHFETKDPVILGDRIITSGLEEKTPKGIIVGIVIQDNINEGVIVQPIVKKEDIEFVQIIKKFNIKNFDANKVFRYRDESTKTATDSTANANE
jgi:rod shape-determining protein MreC